VLLYVAQLSRRIELQQCKRERMGRVKNIGYLYNRTARADHALLTSVSCAVRAIALHNKHSLFSGVTSHAHGYAFQRHLTYLSLSLPEQHSPSTTRLYLSHASIQLCLVLPPQSLSPHVWAYTWGWNRLSTFLSPDQISFSRYSFCVHKFKAGGGKLLSNI